MKKIVLLGTLLIATTVVSAHTVSKVSDDLRIEGNWCEGTYALIADGGKKEGIWQWTLDGKVLTKETTHLVNMAQYGLGKYEVSLVNANGKILLTDSYQLTTLPGPKADFGFDYLFAAGLVKFTNMTTSNTTDLTWIWDFGDGKTSNNQYPSHAYEKEGTYLVKLTATDASGCSNTVSMEVVWKYPGH